MTATPSAAMPWRTKKTQPPEHLPVAYAHGLAFGALTSWRLLDRADGIDTTAGMDALLRLRDVADRLLAAEVTA